MSLISPCFHSKCYVFRCYLSYLINRLINAFPLKSLAGSFSSNVSNSLAILLILDNVIPILHISLLFLNPNSPMSFISWSILSASKGRRGTLAVLESILHYVSYRFCAWSFLVRVWWLCGMGVGVNDHHGCVQRRRRRGLTVWLNHLSVLLCGCSGVCVRWWGWKGESESECVVVSWHETVREKWGRGERGEERGREEKRQKHKREEGEEKRDGWQNWEKKRVGESKSGFIHNRRYK